MGDTGVVYIIDDDESLRVVIDSLLRSVGLQTRLYASVSAFLAGPRPETAGCLILDVRLPGTSGLDFQAQLAGYGIHLPVILMTGHGDIPMSVRAMKAGAVDFLPKPFRDQDMLDAVATAIGRDEARRTAEAEDASLRDRQGCSTLAERLN
jgi:FixJ family two-component response regulator